MTINTDSTIKALSYGRVTQKAPWHSGRMADANLLVYISSGRLKMEVDGTACRLIKGDLLYIPEGVETAVEEILCEYAYCGGEW